MTQQPCGTNVMAGDSSMKDANKNNNRIIDKLTSFPKHITDLHMLSPDLQKSLQESLPFKIHAIIAVSLVFISFLGLYLIIILI